MQVRNIDFTGIAILIAGAGIAVVGYLAYKKAGDLASGAGELAAKAIEAAKATASQVVEIPQVVGAAIGATAYDLFGDDPMAIMDWRQKAAQNATVFEAPTYDALGNRTN